MGVVYVLSHDRDEIAISRDTYDAVLGDIEKDTGIKEVHKPKDDKGKDSLWPWGITDGVYYAWFGGQEGDNQLHFWGSNLNSEFGKKVFDYFKRLGVRIIGSF